jgi:hypothetical protein
VFDEQLEGVVDCGSFETVISLQAIYIVNRLQQHLRLGKAGSRSHCATLDKPYSFSHWFNSLLYYFFYHCKKTRQHQPVMQAAASVPA